MWAAPSERRAEVDRKRDGVEEFLRAHGLKEVIEDTVKELLLNEPNDGGEWKSPSGDIAKGVFEFMASRMAYRLGARSEMERAVDLVAMCNPRCGDVLQDNAAEAFSLLAKSSGTAAAVEEVDKLETGLEVEATAITTESLNFFLDRICDPLPSFAKALLLDLVKWPHNHPFLVSLNDFMCALNPCIAMKELIFCAEEEFNALDEDEDGLVDIQCAAKALSEVNWSVPRKMRRRSCWPSGSETRVEVEHDWQSSAKKIVSDLPPCPREAEPSDLDRERIAKALFSATRSSNTVFPSGCVNEEVFVRVVVLDLSPLSKIAKSWLLQ